MGKNKKLTLCKYGSKCYRRNPQHLEEFSHPEQNENEESEDTNGPATKKQKQDQSDSENDSMSDKEVEKKKPTTHRGESSSTPEASENDDTDGGADTIPQSPEDIKENIKQKFLVEMPEDFYEFFEFAKGVNGKDPCDAFKKSLGLQLVGPFDILAGKHKKKTGKRACYLRHWRYYYDPPEFQTIIRGDDDTQFHMGYFRDDPLEMPAFVASNSAANNCTMTARGENIFAAIKWFVDDKCKTDKLCKAKMGKLQEMLTKHAEKKKFLLELKTKSLKARDKKVVCKSFHGAGIVVPINDQGIGYREVPETTGDLKRMFKKIAESKDEKERDTNTDPLMELIMLIQFANDECDYGEGLELGMDLFSYGGECFHGHIKNLMPLAYQLLGRHQYGKILLAHLENRKHTANLSELD